MIDLRKEKLIGLADAGQLLPAGRFGSPVSASCILRWIQRGVKLPSGERVRLEGVRLGKRWLTSMEALQRFADRQTPHHEEEPAPLPRSVEQRAVASALAGEELEAMWAPSTQGHRRR